jgi:hypothetical protein
MGGIPWRIWGFFLVTTATALKGLAPAFQYYFQNDCFDLAAAKTPYRKQTLYPVCLIIY